MANHKSALKRIRQTAKRREHNRYYAKTMRNAVRRFRELDNKKEAEEKLKEQAEYLKEANVLLEERQGALEIAAVGQPERGLERAFLGLDLERGAGRVRHDLGVLRLGRLVVVTQPWKKVRGNHAPCPRNHRKTDQHLHGLQPRQQRDKARLGDGGGEHQVADRQKRQDAGDDPERPVELHRQDGM